MADGVNFFSEADRRDAKQRPEGNGKRRERDENNGGSNEKTTSVVVAPLVVATKASTHCTGEASGAGAESGSGAGAESGSGAGAERTGTGQGRAGQERERRKEGTRRQLGPGTTDWMGAVRVSVRPPLLFGPPPAPKRSQPGAGPRRSNPFLTRFRSGGAASAARAPPPWRSPTRCRLTPQRVRQPPRGSARGSATRFAQTGAGAPQRGASPSARRPPPAGKPLWPRLPPPRATTLPQHGRVVWRGEAGAHEGGGREEVVCGDAVPDRVLFGRVSASSRYQEPSPIGAR